LIGSAHIWIYVAWSLVAAMGSAAGTYWLVDWTKRHSILDVPNERSSHAQATPRGGGIAIVASTILSGLMALAIWPDARSVLLPLLLAAAGIAYVSWLDDLKPLPNRIRFAMHLCGAVLVTWFTGPLEAMHFGGFGRFNLGLAAWPLTILWIVGMTNAFNFMDGIDGIAGITAVVAGLSIAVGAACMGYTAVAIISSGFAAASVGFLVCNWPPARIFMGDVGSAFCGFFIATAPLCTAPISQAALVTVAGLTLWPFVFDTLYTLIRRIRQREDIFKAHRSHIYQRLVIAGKGHRDVSLLYAALSLVGAAIGLIPLFSPEASSTASVIAAVYLVTCASVLVLLVKTATLPAESFEAVQSVRSRTDSWPGV
jgi:UDP-N-acetylmuramyl pentapeptide phosphotransferase/UDP-N-acetylglucosamine-1-phosphate transferase